MKDFTDVLIEIPSDLIDKGFELPIYMFAVSQSGSLVATRYKWDGIKKWDKGSHFCRTSGGNRMGSSSKLLFC
jgi:hypothetical protein